MIGDPRVGPMDIRADGRTKRQVVGWLPTHGWAGRAKQEKKREKEAVCGFLWLQLGTRVSPGGKGLGAVGEGWRRPSGDPAERAWARPLSGSREACLLSVSSRPVWEQTPAFPYHQLPPRLSPHLSPSPTQPLELAPHLAPSRPLPRADDRPFQFLATHPKPKAPFQGPSCLSAVPHRGWDIQGAFCLCPPAPSLGQTEGAGECQGHLVRGRPGSLLQLRNCQEARGLSPEAGWWDSVRLSPSLWTQDPPPSLAPAQPSPGP